MKRKRSLRLIACPWDLAAFILRAMTAPQFPWHQRLDAFPAWTPGLIFLLGVALLLPSIWSETSITASDEYALTFRTPMEMQERGQFLTPDCNEEPRLRKPPLMYWLILGAYKTVGVNLVSARIWDLCRS